MPYSFSDHLGPTSLTTAINATQTTIQLDSLPSGFVTDVDNATTPRFPVRVGGQNRASHERVIVTGVNAANNEIVVERGAEYGADSHDAGTRVAHAVPETTMTRIDALSDAVRTQENGSVEHLYIPDQSKLYEDSAATVGASIDGPVGAWEDQSGDHLATQSTTANKPTLRQDVNGNLWVEFASSEDFLETDVTTPETTKVSTIPGAGAFSAEVDPSIKSRSKARIQSTTAGVLVRGGTYSQAIRDDWAAVLDRRGKDVADAVTSFQDYFRSEPLVHYDAHAQDTSQVTNMRSMFYDTSVSDLSPLSGWTVSNVTDMRSMFNNTSVSDLSPLSGWDTSQVTNMGSMFRRTSVSDLSPLSGWDTSQVTHMGDMFNRTSVSDLSPLSGWTVSNVTNMNYMFSGTSVSDLTPLSGWTVSNVTNMSAMFYDTSVSDLSPLSGWTVSNVTDMRSMFNNTSVSDLSPLSGWTVSNVTDMRSMFYNTSVSDPSPISGWDIGAVNDLSRFLDDAPLDDVFTGDMLAGWIDGTPNTETNLQAGVTLGIQNADYNAMNANGQSAVDALCSDPPNWTINATNAPANC